MIVVNEIEGRGWSRKESRYKEGFGNLFYLRGWGFCISFLDFKCNIYSFFKFKVLDYR